MVLLPREPSLNEHFWRYFSSEKCRKFTSRWNVYRTVSDEMKFIFNVLRKILLEIEMNYVSVEMKSLFWKSFRVERNVLSIFSIQNREGTLLTAGSRWKMTTRPPLSPVAKRSPSWLNSTQEIMSAEISKGNF